MEVASMTVCIDPLDVRQIVIQSFLELDITEDALADLEEKLLIEEGRYFARSYLAGDLMAMWLIEVGVLQFYDAEGNMLRTVNLFEELMPVRMAA
jgi:hypothetical protein